MKPQKSIGSTPDPSTRQPNVQEQNSVKKNLSWAKDPKAQAGVATGIGATWMFFLGAIPGALAFLLAVWLIVSGARAEGGFSKNRWILVSALVMILGAFIPEFTGVPKSFRNLEGTERVVPEVLRDDRGGQEQSTTRGEAQGDGAENASWSHTFGSTALIAFISPLEGQTEEQIESRTVILPGQGLVSVGVEGAYTYNSTDGNMLIDPAGGVVTLHGAVSQNQPTKNQDKFPAPQFNWGEMLYRPASPEQEWNEGWNPVRGSVQLEAGKPYEFALNINQSNLTYFSVNGLTLYLK